MYALLWVIYPSEAGVSGLQVLNYYALYSGLSLGFFNIIFAYQVIRFTRGKTSRRKTLIVAALTLFIPLIAILYGWPVMFSSRVFAYVGPIPIQLITGLSLMHLAGQEQSTSPW